MTLRNTLWVKCCTGDSVRVRNDSWFMIAWFPVIAIWNVEALLAPMPGISDAITGIMLNDLVSEVDAMKYQQSVMGYRLAHE